MSHTTKNTWDEIRSSVKKQAFESLTELNYVERAEAVIRKLCKEEKSRDGKKIMKIEITTSKIRKLLSMISNLYNEVIRSEVKGDQLDTEMLGKIQYLKMHFAYEAGREKSVKDFIEKAAIFEAVDQIGKSKKQFIIFCRYMEALVAYRKFYADDKE